MTTTVLTNYGGWLLNYPAIHASFLQKLSGDALERVDRSVKHEPDVEDFRDAIDKGGMLPWFDEVLKQVDVKSTVCSSNSSQWPFDKQCVTSILYSDVLAPCLAYKDSQVDPLTPSSKLHLLSTMTNITAFVGYGGWIPKHPDIHKNFIKNLVKHARDSARRSHKHEPAVAAFAKAIEDGGMRPLFDQTFKQIRKPQGNHTLKRFDPDHQVENFEELLQALDQIVVTAPKYHVVRYPNGDVIGEPIGVPIYIVLDLLSNTSAGYDLFRMKPFNDAMKNLLDSWGKFLMEAGSNNTLNKTAEGWFGELGIRNLSQNLGTYTFDQTFKCPDPSADNRGFKSWDAFFTRELQDGVRPIDTNGIILQPGRSPHTAGLHPPTIIYSPSESTVVRIADNVQHHDQFWLKGQQYSLYDMLDHDDEYAKRFEGGTVYQSFLSPSDYHRWHSPIKGTIEKIVMVEGTYYAALPDDGAEEGDPDLEQGDPHGALIRSMPFLTVSAARALIYIKSHDNTIGTVCFIAVGMVEVSTCQLTVKENDLVEPGTQLGMFHFGGSSSVIIFPKGVKFTPYKEHGVQLGKHVWVNSVLGIAERV